MKRRQFSFHFSLPQPELRFDWRGWLPSRGNVLFTLVMIAVLLWAQSAGAVSQFATRNSQLASTGTIAYQGRLADSAGNPLTGRFRMEFRLYNVNSSGIAVWTEEWDSTNEVIVSDGLFNVVLGSLTPIPQSVITGNPNLFLGISVGNDDEMSPRVQLGSVPFAVQALTVPDGSITAEKIADGAVTTVKLNLERGLSFNGDLSVNGSVKTTIGEEWGVGAFTASGNVEPGIRLDNTNFTTWDIFSGGGGYPSFNNRLTFYNRDNNSYAGVASDDRCLRLILSLRLYKQILTAPANSTPSNHPTSASATKG